eukprot:15341534-Ditylum_brightwellii.AAC.1
MIKATSFKVQLEPGKPNLTIGNIQVKNKGLAIHILKSYVMMLHDLMLQVVPYVENKGVKFVPANLPHDKLIQNGKHIYANLLKEQNLFPTNYDDVGIGGVSEHFLDF